MYKIFARVMLGCACIALTQWVVAEDAMRDPTRPLGYHSQTQGGKQLLRLQSVLISETRKLAIINGQTLHESDFIDGTSGIRVKRIENNSMTLQQGEKSWSLVVNNLSVRQ